MNVFLMRGRFCRAGDEPAEHDADQYDDRKIVGGCREKKTALSITHCDIEGHKLTQGKTPEKPEE